MEKDTDVNAGPTQGQKSLSEVLDEIECRKGVAARFAAEEMDWMQVVLNGGPPCFHLCDDLHFCGRAKQWDGHGEPGFHNFTSLADLIAAARSDVPRLVEALWRAIQAIEVLSQEPGNILRSDISGGIELREIASILEGQGSQ